MDAQHHIWGERTSVSETLVAVDEIGAEFELICSSLILFFTFVDPWSPGKNLKNKNFTEDLHYEDFLFLHIECVGEVRRPQ